MSKIASSRATFGRMTKTQKTIDLPISTGTAAEIDLSGTLYAQVYIRVAGDFYWTIADTAAEAATRLGSLDTKCREETGHLQIPCVANVTEKLYLISTGAAISEGISYAYVESD